MQIQNSSSKFKSKLLKLILMLLITLTAFQFATPITAYADIDYTGGGGGHYVGKLFWGGSTNRTGFLFYILIDGQVMTANLIGAGSSNDKYAVTIVHANDKPVFDLTMNQDFLGEEVLHQFYKTHFGSLSPNQTIWWTDGMGTMPYPVYWDDDTSQWYSNEEDVLNWLYSELPDGDLVWEYIVKYGFSSELYEHAGEVILDWLKTLPESRITLCVEPISCQAVYGTETWTEDDWNTFKAEIEAKNGAHPDQDYLDFVNENWGGSAVGKPKPQILLGRIRRILTTGRYAAAKNYSLTSFYGIPTSKYGGANKKWTNEAMPFCMMITEEHFGIQPMDANADIISCDQIYGDNATDGNENGYAIAIFTSQEDYISTYNGTATFPDYSEEPVDDGSKDTTGNCTITKIYFDVEIDGLTGEKTYKFVDAFTTEDTTGYIILMPEYGKTSYHISKWATTLEQKDYSQYYNAEGYHEIVRRLSTATFNGTRTGLVQHFILDNENKGEEGKRKHLYIVYTKTTTTPPPSIQSHDFEIPESYITKQVYFSKAQNTSNTQNTAQKLTKNTFKWTSEAHNNCQGHEALTCTTPEHTHTTALSYRAGSINCGYTYEHTHSDGDSCIRYQYKCLAQSISQCIKNNQPSIPPNHKVF